VNKKMIIIIVAAGLISFAGAFVLARLIKPSSNRPIAEATQPRPASEEETVLKLAQPQMPTTGTVGAIDSKMKRAMTEEQLKSLVYEVREKIQEYNSKLDGLKVSEQRLQVAGDTLKKDTEELDNLRIELASTVAHLRSERDKLLKSRVEIAKKEKSNLISIAATYDKMAPEAAGKILTNMSQAQNDSADDAVKIFYYMSERTRAKVLASIAEAEPALSAFFCQKLKQIIEKE